MKVTKVEKTFEPVTISITFETEKEMNIFGSLFNHIDICDVLRSNGLTNPEYIRKAIEENGGDVNLATKITEHLEEAAIRDKEIKKKFF